MAGMEDMLRMASKSNLLFEHLEFASKWSEIGKASAWLGKTNGFGMLQEMITGMHEQHKGVDGIAKAIAQINRQESSLSSLGSVERMIKGLASQELHASVQASKMAGISKAIIGTDFYQLSQKALATIGSIGMHQQTIFNNYSTVTEAIQKTAALTKMNGLQWALNGISGQMASIAAKTKKWNLLDDFEEITEEAAAISDKVNEQEYVTKDDISEIKAFIERIEIKIDKKDKDVFSIVLKLMAVIGFILSLLAEVRTHTHKPDAATKNDIELLRKEIQDNSVNKLTDNKEYRTASRSCKVVLKPNLKSYVQVQLPAGYNIIVLQNRHEWLFISYSNPKDGLTETGWVLKKYFPF